jgi:threonylcarbamoyladenosine tRNA methylthiotransferase MtaB
MNRKIAFKTLGCRLNQFETDSLVSQFHRHDYEVVDFAEDADVYIVNTCTVTKQGDGKSRRAIYQASRHGDSPVVIITGCMVNSNKDKLKQLNGVTYFVENEQKSSIYSLVDAHFNGETVNPRQFKKDVFGFEPAEETLHTRSFIKIQDGCDNFCTYCIVPRVRGRAVSRPVEDILHNIREVLGFGFKEIVLTGVNLGRYNHGNISFEQLVEKILNLPGDFRLRISSIEPEGFGDRLFDLFSHPKLAPHLHLCLQSGSDRILRLMNRMYDLGTYLDMINRIREHYPDFNFTTDIISGFPGETDEDFRMTCQVVKETGFSHVHTFKYSVREGTRAGGMEDQVPEKVKTERSSVIRQIALENKIKYRRSLIGKKQVVLVERFSQHTKLAKGYGELYVPVEFPAVPDSHNRFYKVRITGFGAGVDPILRGDVV